MKRSVKMITVLLATAALVGWVACSDSSEGTDTTPPTDTIQDTQTDVPPTDVPPTDVERDVPPTDVPPTDVPPTDVPTDTPPVDVPPVDIPCQPNCAGRVCGSDGCGGTCAPGCTGTDVCSVADGTCVPACDWATDKPTTWGPTGVISSLQTPADVAVVQATCFDYTGDDKGDNGLKGLAGQVNGPLADAVSGGSIAILFELLGVTDFATTASFQLNGLLGVSTVEPPATTGDFYVQDSSYIEETCMPMIYFKNAKITAGVLEAGPSMFQLSIPIQEGLVIDATLIQAKLKGTIKNGDAATGFELEGGVLSGVLTKEQLQAAIDKLQATCDAAPAAEKPDYCSYLTVAKSAMALLFDLHQVKGEDGSLTFVAKSKEMPGDAASVCLTYGLSKAKVIGFEPVTP